MRASAIESPGLYLFAMPSIALIQEQAAAFQSEASGLDITEAHSESRNPGTVQVQLNRTIERLTNAGMNHAVVLTTHESLMAADLSSFSGWHARIDEAPNAVQGGTIKLSAYPDLLAQYFGLQPVRDTGWSEVIPLTDAPSWSDVASDDVVKPLAEFIKRANSPSGVFVDCTRWGTSFGWCSVWLPTSLQHFETCQIGGASYGASLGALIAKRWVPDVLFAETVLPMPRTGLPTIAIHYFTEAHEGTTKLWDTSAGRKCIVGACDFLAKLDPPVGYWAGNSEVAKLMEHRVRNGPISVKVAGMNEWRKESRCALIYSSKPTPNDEPVKTLFGLTDQEIRCAREDEDVIQFAMRGAVRNSDFAGQYDIYLYTKRQAETLAGRLRASDVGKTITLVPEVGAGIMHFEPAPMVRTRKALVESKTAERRRKKADSARASRAKKAVAEGRQPSANGGRGGRPKKDKLSPSGEAC